MPFSPMRTRKGREKNQLNLELKLEDATAKLENLESALAEKTEELANYRFESVSAAEKICEDHNSVVRALKLELNEKKASVKLLESTIHQNAGKRAEVGRQFRDKYNVIIDQMKVNFFLFRQNSYIRCSHKVFLTEQPQN